MRKYTHVIKSQLQAIANEHNRFENMISTTNDATAIAAYRVTQKELAAEIEAIHTKYNSLTKWQYLWARIKNIFWL